MRMLVSDLELARMGITRPYAGMPIRLGRYDDPGVLLVLHGRSETQMAWHAEIVADVQEKTQAGVPA